MAKHQSIKDITKKIINEMLVQTFISQAFILNSFKKTIRKTI